MSSGNLCNILICGFHEDSGLDIVESLVLELVNKNRLRYFTVDELNIVKSTDFFQIYNKLKYFDYIILCRRHILSLTSDKSKINKYIEQYNCWTLFANIIIPYEDSYENMYTLLYNMFNTLEPIQEECSSTETKNKKLLSFLQSNGYEKQKSLIQFDN
jgi:hypothetical protein